MAGRFIHLHTHSHYSFLQALPKIDELVEKAKKEGMDALALTDTGNMHGAIEFYKAAAKAGIKPILGVDAYLAPRSRLEKDSVLDAKRSRIVLLAENNEGYKNLLALVTKSWTEGFFERPRIDKELLREHGRGLIALLPSFAGDVSQCLRAGDSNGAAAALAEFKTIFGAGNVFLELTHHPKVAGHEELMRKVVDLARGTDTPLVAQNDVYYLEPDDRAATEIMRRIQQGGRGRNEDEDFSFLGEKAAEKLFKDTPDALDNCRIIADRCSISIQLDQWVFPTVPVSSGFASHDEELRAKAYAGLATRNLEKTPEIVERIDYELKVIIDKGFAVYFLMVADLLNFAKSAGIVTTTRGSAAGSFVAYLTGITNVNPIYYKLPFERFLNPERPKAPDIDMDMADNRRDDMIAYAKTKYGDDHVAQVGTFGTMMARAAVRDVSRALGHSYTTGDRIAKLIPMGSQGFPMTIDKALELEPDLKALYDEDDDAKEIVDLAKRIEGCVRHVGVHAAGVIISPTPIIEWVPVQPDPKGTGKLITQYDMYSVTDDGGVGLLKFDFLGIKNLAILADAVSIVKGTRGINIDIENVPIDDAKTYEMLARGETEGVFQLNGSGMTRWLKELKPSTIHDINAMVALYRPGPMETIPSYIERKHNPKLIHYLDPRMQEYLDFSYGLLVYQEDVLLTSIKLAGYSWLDADKLRKAMGKKIPAVMQAEKEKLFKGFMEYGKLSKQLSEKLWELIEPFAAYGFGKAHAASYGKVAYQTAYMKANYPVEYLTALLTADSGDTEAIAVFVAEAKRMGIPVLPPDVNESGSVFTVVHAEAREDTFTEGAPERDGARPSKFSAENYAHPEGDVSNGPYGNAIRFGLSSIKNFGEGIAEAIITEREARGAFTSLSDFLSRVGSKNLNRKSLESLIKCGALDSLSPSLHKRGTLLENIETLLAFHREATAVAPQDSLFGALSAPPALILPEGKPTSLIDKLAWEKELLGIYVSGHPLDAYEALTKKASLTIAKIKAEPQTGMLIILPVLVSLVRSILTKGGEKMAFITVGDQTDSIEAVVFPKLLKEHAVVVAPGTCLLIKGKVSVRNGEPSLAIEELKPL